MLFCPVRNAVDNLAREGITKGVHLVGDTMYDAITGFVKTASRRSRILTDLGLEPKGYLLATIHRQSNADDSANLGDIFKAFGMIRERIILPLHPRTGKALKRYGIKAPRNVTVTYPLGYLDMLMLEKNARIIMTDSGGMQKESYWLGVPCLTMRDETEWVETVASGWNMIVGCDPERIAEGIRRPWRNRQRPLFYGDGHAAEKIADHIIKAGETW
jgi:UDP-N-acetylglucosamine 2-epimerase